MLLYRRHSKKQTRPTLGELSKLLQSEVRHISKVFIVIDALDECPESNRTRESFLAGPKLFSLLRSLGIGACGTAWRHVTNPVFGNIDNWKVA